MAGAAARLAPVRHATKGRTVALDAFSRAQVLELLRCAKAARERDWLMCLVAFLHGLRASEVVAIIRDDIADGKIDVRRLKGSKRTRQMLFEHPDALLNERAGLEKYMRGMAGESRLFPIGRHQFWRLVQRYGKQAGIPKDLCHPHTFKHSIAHELVDKKEPINIVQQHLGHKSGASTLKYLRTTDAEASAATQRALNLKS